MVWRLLLPPPRARSLSRRDRWMGAREAHARRAAVEWKGRVDGNTGRRRGFLVFFPLGNSDEYKIFDVTVFLDDAKMKATDFFFISVTESRGGRL